MTKWLDVIGVPETGVQALGPELRAVVNAAGTIIGVPRRLAGLEVGEGVDLVAWDGALDEMLSRILAARKTPTVLLASGDPNWFGIGATLTRHLPCEEFALYPAPSSFQLAAARLHWPMQNVATVSLHGRAVSALHPHVLPGNRVLALTSGAGTVREVGGLLSARGFGRSRLTVLEDLGADTERVLSFEAGAAAGRQTGDFHVLAIDCVADGGAPLLPPMPGLPDGAFASDGQLTKREVRAATLAKLAPFPGGLLWDVGAGCGSVGIEWMRAVRGARCICFEREPERLETIAANREALGVPMLESVGGEAPASLTGRPAPDAVFLGGDVGNGDLFEACWQALKPGGRLVANAVTIEGEKAVYERHGRLGGDLARIEVSVLGKVGDHRALRPRMAVTQWLVVKEGTR